jgi:AcrR family transcriptional regulator
LRVLAEHGAETISVGQIARESGVHETTIYRRWSTREQLIMDALLSYSQERLPIPDTGTLRADLIAFACSLVAYLASPFGAALVRAMAVSDGDSAMAASREEFWQSRRELSRVMLDRAAARGEVPADIDVTLALELLIAPLHFRALLTRHPLDEHEVGRIVDLLLDGLAR